MSALVMGSKLFIDVHVCHILAKSLFPDENGCIMFVLCMYMIAVILTFLYHNYTLLLYTPLCITMYLNAWNDTTQLKNRN